MSDTSQPSLTCFTISAVERDTGLSKDILRVWERRYRFPQPDRDQHGERLYPFDQVEKLRTIKRLMDIGHRPGKLVGHSMLELQSLSAGLGTGETRQRAVPEHLRDFLDLIKSHSVYALRQQLSQRLMRQGLHRFLTETVTPLNQLVGEAWMSGQFEIFEEHLYTETLQGLLRTAISAMPDAGHAPLIMLTTLPNEQHNLGLLMAEAIFSMEGATCISLGTQTPVRDIAMAAAAHKADIVAVSFSAAFAPAQVCDSLEALRGQLAPGIPVWAGGGNAGLSRRAIAGVTILQSLDQVALAIAEWRDSRVTA
jgi:methanogenic corrinoid protein MtbC1